MAERSDRGGGRLRVRLRLGFYVAAVAFAAAAAVGAAAGGGTAERPLVVGARVTVFWLLYLAAETTVVQVPVGPARRGIPPTLSGGFLVLMTAAFATDPATAAIVGALSGLSLPELRGRREPIRVVFNAAQGSLYTGAASAVFFGLAAVAPPGARVLATAAAPAVAAGVAFLINTGLVAGALAAESRRPLRQVWRTLRWPAPTYLGFAYAAFLVATVLRHRGLASAVFLIGPLAVVRWIHAGYAELEGALWRTLRAFVRTVELKDYFTRDHSERVAEIAVAIAQELGRPESDQERLFRGGLVHDLGKLAVSGRILSKPGPLTPGEYEIVKRHPEVGARAAEGIELLRPLLPQILYHHERIDGLGYPCGLSGQDIPSDARILAVADTYEALTRDRPYRARLSVGDALAELRRVAGTQLDPVPVAALEAVVSRGRDFPIPIGPRRLEWPFPPAVSRGAV